ncbi:MAG: HU family DNA-binding protein [Candidatus Marinimicrobia bacterium]|nr:HU family DNA-binding protein [Candidatus Neomarinimicrobiota bacterium]
MNNSELVKILAQRVSLSQKETRSLLDKSVETLADTLGDYIGFSIPDLGTFGTHIREERQAYDLNMKSHVILPPKRLVEFSPAVGLKADIKDVEVPEQTEKKPAREAADSSPEVSLKELPAVEETPESSEEEEDARAIMRRENIAAGIEAETEAAPAPEPEPAGETAAKTGARLEPTPEAHLTLERQPQPDSEPIEAATTGPKPNLSATVEQTAEPPAAAEPRADADASTPTPAPPQAAQPDEADE